MLMICVFFCLFIATTFLKNFSHPQIQCRLYLGSPLMFHEENVPEVRSRPPSSPIVARRLIMASLGRRDPSNPSVKSLSKV